MHTFFCGIGGSGMSALALLLRQKGSSVSGSDRSFDTGSTAPIFSQLKKAGITLCPQDGSGIETSDRLIVSTAIEDRIPDVKAAKEKNIPIIKRSELLAEQFHSYPKGIAVGGTSGKTTVTGMTGHILASAGMDPTIINGGLMKDMPGLPGPANMRPGNGDSCVIEADESDGSIALYRPHIALVTNISLDHKPLEELIPLFTDFIARADYAVLNADCPHSQGLKKRKGDLSFSLGGEADLAATDISPTQKGIDFTVSGHRVSLDVPGRHNIANGLAAIAAAMLSGVPLKDAAEALSSFGGIGRRLDLIGERGGITVIDDFGHNPKKIAASLDALHDHDGRLIVFFQPHGFAPTKLMKDELIAMFGRDLKANDRLVMPEIYYAGGTADKSISSTEIIDPLKEKGCNASFFEKREDAFAFIAEEARPGDRLIVMGARDDSLTACAKTLLNKVGTS